MKIKKISCANLCLFLCIAFGASCSQDQMSKVTIYFGQIPLAKAEKQDVLDRIFAFFLTRAHAEWSDNYTSITMTVTGDEMDTITAPIAPGSSSFTIEVPMGKSRIFTLIAYEGTFKKWGGTFLLTSTIVK